MLDLHLHDRSGIHERAVRTAEILNENPFRRRADHRMMPGNIGFRNHDIAVVLTPDNQRFPVDRNLPGIAVPLLKCDGRKLALRR